MRAFVEPHRVERHLPDGNWEVRVTPPKFSHFHGSSVTLTPDQHRRYLEWLDSGVLIQIKLPDLLPHQREILLSGIGPDEWDGAFGDDE